MTVTDREISEEGWVVLWNENTIKLFVTTYILLFKLTASLKA